MKRTPLRRKTPLRSRSKTKAYRRRTRDLDYMRVVRKLPCIVRTWGELSAAKRIEAFETLFRLPGVARISFVIGEPTTCIGRVQADHAGKRGLGMKSDDTDCIALCEQHHRERTDYSGMFKDWDGARMRMWCIWAIATTRATVLAANDCKRCDGSGFEITGFDEDAHENIERPCSHEEH